jgi:hypothetical protein
VDEENCDPETYFLCARDQEQEKQVDLLACMDAHKNDIQSCCKSLSIDFKAVSECFKGSRGADLRVAAAKHFDTKFPSAVGIPHIEINGKEEKQRDLKSLLQTLCATGIQAGACSNNATSSQEVVATSSQEVVIV